MAHGGETPKMAASTRTASHYNPNEGVGAMVFAASGDPFGELAAHQLGQQTRRFNPILNARMEVIEMPAAARRIIQVFISDTNPNVPLDDCLIYEGKQKLTDATDQELFFEINIKELLDAHNVKRTKVVDKTVKDRTEYLEPAKIRDLKMTVVTVTNL